ncbi:plasma membrane iron permease [Aaosphaeria arxii CBS 175.79]|uniref:Plasma membrane iron permease n=1 Tax=Aaosphaeria arxii CBS 175.79 TaxID=1450172 RepID=A0A6A5XS83_9PLEO|nr:plasma membrane iron permease [Aaosphaeria arxii CBS 175.79]KAF2015124.1 plasma membrane iron permease [Aaosphaeria arxii CBS 175.79]
MGTNVFAVQLFFVCFRESLEASIIISVLLSFVKQCMGQPGQDPEIYKRLRRQIWLGSGVGALICLIIGGAFIGVFYGLGHDIWAQSEDLWEGIFYLIASIIITVMGLTLLRINKAKEKWRVKIAKSLLKNQEDGVPKHRLATWSRKYAMFILPFITVLREGLEAVVFIGGVSLGLPATAFPIPIITGFAAGLLIGYFVYRGGNVMSIQIFLIASTCVLYLISAGMFSKSVWSLEMYRFSKKTGGDVAESGTGPGSYDISSTVWHINCCSGELDHGWDVFNALLGWENTATYGSVLSYNFYWIFIIVSVWLMRYQERHGSIPGTRSMWKALAKVPGFRTRAAEALNGPTESDRDIIARVQASNFHGENKTATGVSTTAH